MVDKSNPFMDGLLCRRAKKFLSFSKYGQEPKVFKTLQRLQRPLKNFIFPYLVVDKRYEENNN